MLVFIIIVLALIFILWFFFFRKQKELNYGCILYITGALKTGKTLLSCKIIDEEYARSLKKWRKANKKRKAWCSIRRKEFNEIDMPLIYSNMPLNVPYVPLTTELLLREKRFVKGSIVYFNEASFLASQMDTKDNNVNLNLNAFVKLFGHEVGSPDFDFDGLLVMDTQNIKDSHYAFKNCCTSFVFIHHKKSFLKFWYKLYLKEYSYVDNVSNNEENDLGDDFKVIYVRKKKYFKWYDKQAYSSFTDDLDVVDNVVMPDGDLKMKNIVSFVPSINEYFDLNKIKKKNKKKNLIVEGGVEIGKEDL